MQVKKILAVAGISLVSLTANAREGRSELKPLSTQTQALSFIENIGQIVDPSGKRRDDIQFKLTASAGLNIFIGNGRIHYQWNKINSAPAQGTESVSSYRMDMELLGANSNATARTEDAQDYYEQFMTGSFSDRAAKARSFRKIIYQDVYPGIDWVLYIKDEALEYDFVVRPGGNPADIQMRYGGADGITKHADGSIAANAPTGCISEANPYAYIKETGKAVETNFILKGNTLSFNTLSKATNNNETLVLDPAIQWATYYGSTGDEKSMAAAYDGSGNIYMCGYTNSTSNIATSGSYQSSWVVGQDGFLVKFNSSGVRQWGTYYGGNGQDQAWGVTCDGSANVYVTGWTSSTSNMASAGAYQTSNGGSPNDAFLVKFDNNGTRQWATYYGGNNASSAQVYGAGVVCDASGNVYMTGYTNATALISTASSYQPSLAGDYDAFLVKFNSSGSRQWATYYGGTSADRAKAITCDGSSNIYISGYTGSSTGIATSGAYQGSIGGSNDAFLAKFNSSGAMQWGTYYGGSGDDQANGVTYDGTSLYCTGVTASTSGIASSGAYQGSLAGGYDVFLAKFSTSGSRTWSTYYGGSDSDFAYATAISSSGDVYISGATSSSSGIATSASYQTTLAGTQNAFLAQFSNSGSRLWATYFGGSAKEQGLGVACDASYGVYMCGGTSSSSGISTTGSHQSSFGGGTYDGFLVKFSATTSVYVAQPFVDTIKCAGDTINVAYTVNFPFSSGNTFTAQLSNASGSFASPVNIGSVAALNAGTIACTIPANTPTGTGYRIRILGSNPVDTSADDGVNIHIYRLPYPNTTNNSPVCIGDTLKITVTDSASAATYSWTGPNSYSSSNPNITKSNMGAADSGNYIVTINYGACQLKDTLHAALKATPATPVATSNSPVCVGGTLNLGATCATSGVSYSWTGPGSFTSTSQNPSITPFQVANAGSYIVKASLNGCSASATITASISPSPATPTITNNSPVCLGDTLKITSGSTSAGVTYSWAGPNSYSSSNQNITKANASYSDSGNYYLTLSLNGCTQLDTVHVSIKPLPAAPTGGSNSPQCAGASLSLNASSTTSGVSYSWTGPNSFSSTTQNPTINPVLIIDSGNYVVKAILNGCSAADTIHVTVKPIPATPTIINNSPVCTGDTLKISASTATSGVTYGWTGPNSFSSSTQNVSIANAAAVNAGSYTLTITLNGCSIQNTVSATVKPLPALPSAGSNSPVCSGANLNLTSFSTTSGVSYSWTGPTSFVSPAQNPTRTGVALTDSGYYVVKATLNGCSSTDSVHVLVISGPQAVNYTTNTPICTGDSLKMNSNSPTAGVTYSWSGPNSFSSSNNSFEIANTTTANAGNYYLTVSVNGCSVHDTILATINPTPSIPVVGSNSAVCAGNNLTLTASSSAGVTYSWTGPSGFTSTSQNPFINSVTAANAGIYVVTASASGCSAKDSTVVTINPKPTLPVANSNTPLCAGDTLKLTGTCTTPGVSYQWSGPSSYVSASQNPQINGVTVANSGNYILNVTLNGCSNSASTSVVVNPALGAPTIHIVASPGDTICSGAAVTFTATITNATNPTYQWKVNGSNVPGATSQTYNTAGLSNLDIVSCLVQSTAPCQPANTGASNAITMHIGSLPAPVVSMTYYPLHYTPGAAVTFTGHVPNGSSGLSYQWSKNGVNIPNATTIVYTTTNINLTDTICFNVKSNVPCTIAAKVCTELSTGVGSLSGIENAVLVFPNPNSGTFTIKTSIDHTITISIFNTIGQSVYTQQADPVNGELNKQIELIVPNGMYMIHISDENSSANIPLMIMK